MKDAGCHEAVLHGLRPATGSHKDELLLKAQRTAELFFV